MSATFTKQLSNQLFELTCLRDVCCPTLKRAHYSEQDCPSTESRSKITTERVKRQFVGKWGQGSAVARNIRQGTWNSLHRYSA
jgi:hypothetical protein